MNHAELHNFLAEALRMARETAVNEAAWNAAHPDQPAIDITPIYTLIGKLRRCIEALEREEPRWFDLYGQIVEHVRTVPGVGEIAP